jgi:hypothetical protein
VDPLRIVWDERGFNLSDNRLKTHRETIENIIVTHPGISGNEIVALAQSAGV